MIIADSNVSSTYLCNMVRYMLYLMHCIIIAFFLYNMVRGIMVLAGIFSLNDRRSAKLKKIPRPGSPSASEALDASLGVEAGVTQFGATSRRRAF